MGAVAVTIGFAGDDALLLTPGTLVTTRCW